MEEQGGFSGNSERSGIISARGTGDGLMIRIDGRVAAENIEEALFEFVRSRRSFLAGNEVSFEWIGGEPSSETVNSLSDGLLEQFGISVKPAKPALSRASLDSGIPSLDVRRGSLEGLCETPSRAPRSLNSSRPASLFDGVEALVSESARSDRSKPSAASDSSLWDDANARVVFSTLRSGQKIETEHSLVIYGDVNSGAEIIAGGDIVVLGTLRGIAHAGAYDETGGGKTIFALSLQPTQLRIGVVISRGAAEQKSGPELARIEGNIIVVEQYSPKVLVSRNRVS